MMPNSPFLVILIIPLSAGDLLPEHIAKLAMFLG
jgi:hypothetical protein